MDRLKAGESLNHLLDLQRALEARMSVGGQSPATVLEVGTAVLEFASSEEQAFFPLLPLLDPAARAELGDEHEQLREDLQLLEWLIASSPDSPDIATLTAAVARRMQEHIARDGRLLAHALRLAGHAGQSGVR